MFISQELQKYAKEPLCHLITLFMLDCAIPPYVTLQDEPCPVQSSILPSFLIDQQSDETSLNFMFIFQARQNNRDSHCWNFLRQLIQEIGFNINPEAYCATCLYILMWSGYSR